MRRAHPGAQLAPSQVIGRDKLIRRLWRILDAQSVVLSAERRMGKTTVIRKMEKEPCEGTLPIYRDLEHIRTPVEFVELVFTDIEGYLSTKKRVAERARLWLGYLTGMEIGTLIRFPEVVAPHWKSVLTKTVEDLAQQQDGTKVVFFWDEMPLMLDNIKKTSGESVAMEVLDALRALRQSTPSLRMVFTGFIGLHNVITSLRKAGYTNDPTNEMIIVDVPPLEPSYAVELALQLLEGEGIATSDQLATAEAIARNVDNIPFFIDHVVAAMTEWEDTITVDTPASIVNAFLTDPYDPWHLRYYRQRLDSYYTQEERKVALALLDALSVSPQPVAFDDLLVAIDIGQVTTDEGEGVRQVLAILQQDHYVIQEADSGLFRFRHSLIQRFWRRHRSLSL